MVVINGQQYKYGKIVYDQYNAKEWNYGDTIQAIAIENVYHRMQIDPADIEEIQAGNISSYRSKGNYKLILPMQGCFNYSKGIDIFPVSKDVIPVFIGFSRCYNGHNKKEYYDKCGKIGCRDETTWKMLKKKNIDAFISGCLTLCFPKRENTPVDGKVFLVDQPKEIEKYMPENLRHKVEYITHETNTNMNLEERTRQLLDRYKNEAELVVTSRLHCASPCLAMGIPVVLVRQYYDARYEWIDKYLPLYTPDEFDQIDWSPKIPDIDDIKEKIMDLACCMLRLENVEAKSENVHSFYMARNKVMTKMPFKTRMYYYVLSWNPKLAYFIRKKILWRFTVINQKE